MKGNLLNGAKNRGLCRRGLLIWILGFGLQLMVVTNSVDAKIIGVDGLLSKVLENNQNIRSFYFEMGTRIFDPEAFSPLDEQREENLVPYETKDRNFFQKTVWVRDEYCLIETLDYAETPLNMYIIEPVNRAFGINLQDSRPFSNEDLVYPYLIFFTKFVAYLKSSLEDIGINTSKVTIEQRESSVVYQLGSDDENILVDPESFAVLEINRQVQVWGRFYPLQIRFSDWDKQYPGLPETARFYINSRLFKEVRILLKQRRVYTPRRNFLSKYHQMLPQFFPFSLDTSYSQ
ncbi:hypothetical protein KKI24_24160 [bacterium]|nr:hypothetical protein [bacterium]